PLPPAVLRTNSFQPSRRPLAPWPNWRSWRAVSPAVTLRENPSSPHAANAAAIVRAQSAADAIHRRIMILLAYFANAACRDSPFAIGFGLVHRHVRAVQQCFAA